MHTHGVMVTQLDCWPPDSACCMLHLPALLPDPACPALLPGVQEADRILQGAKEKDVSFLVVGDPFGWALLCFVICCLVLRASAPLQINILPCLPCPPLLTLPAPPRPAPQGHHPHRP
jgi:hypothetical protein